MQYRVRAIKRLEVEGLGASFFLSLSPFAPVRLHFIRCWIENV